MNGLSDKVAIVTGGATKIGAAVVAAFVDAGTKVVVADIDDEGGQKLAVDLGDAVRFVRDRHHRRRPGHRLRRRRRRSLRRRRTSW